MLLQSDVRLLRRLRDPKLQKAAESVLAKLAAVVPRELQSQLVAAPLFVSEGSAPAVNGIDHSQLRNAIRETRKLAIAYVDEEDRHTQQNDLADRDGVLCRRNPSRCAGASCAETFAIFASTAFSARSCSTSVSRPTAAS